MFGKTRFNRLYGGVMKKIALISCLAFAMTQSANAVNIEFGTNYSNQESQLCLDAVTGVKSLETVAKEMGVGLSALDRNLKCNGVSVSQFVKNHKPTQSVQASTITTEDFALKAGHASGMAKLCVIAATGDIHKLYRASKMQGITAKQFIKQGQCNNLSVVDFVNKYGGQQSAKVIASRL